MYTQRGQQRKVVCREAYVLKVLANDNVRLAVDSCDLMGLTWFIA